MVDLSASARAFGVAWVCAAALIGVARINGPTGVIGVATYVLGLLATGAVVAGSFFLARKRMRVDGALLVAIGLGAAVGLYVTLWVVL